MKKFVFCLLACSTAAFSQDAPPENTTSKGPSVQEYYSYMQEAIDDEDYWSAVDFGGIILNQFPSSPYINETPFQMGMSYYHLKQYELANETLNDYLKKSVSPKHFEEAIEIKYSIAEFFRQGGKKRLFGSHKLPAIIPAREEAIQIYDEVIATLPHHEIAIHSLLGKAEIQAYLEDFKPSIETLQLLIRRFPKHELAAEGYLQINKVYLQQCQKQHLDPDLLDLAEANVRKFGQAFPREPRLVEAQQSLDEMKEIYAKNLLETGEFYQHRKQKDASRIYFANVMSKYPNTRSAIAAREKLDALKPDIPK